MRAGLLLAATCQMPWETPRLRGSMIGQGMLNSCMPWGMQFMPWGTPLSSQPLKCLRRLCSWEGRQIPREPPFTLSLFLADSE